MLFRQTCIIINNVTSTCFSHLVLTFVDSYDGVPGGVATNDNQDKSKGYSRGWNQQQYAVSMRKDSEQTCEVIAVEDPDDTVNFYEATNDQAEEHLYEDQYEALDEQALRKMAARPASTVDEAQHRLEASFSYETPSDNTSSSNIKKKQAPATEEQGMYEEVDDSN
jgi:hypothetical protein